MLAAAFRLVYSGVLMVAVGQLVGVTRLLSDDGKLALLGADQLNAQALMGITAFNDIWYAGQFLFGLHLLLTGYLAYRAGYVPKILGVPSPYPVWATPLTALARYFPRPPGPISAPSHSSANSCWGSGL